MSCILPSTEWLNNENTPEILLNVGSTDVNSVSNTNTSNTLVKATFNYVTYKKVRYKGKYHYKWVVTYKKVYKSVAKAAVKTSIVATGLKLTSSTVSATAKCSCGALGDYSFHKGTFHNYCPECLKYGVLKWNPKETAEGEWTCGSCGADYCAACGKEKIRNNPNHLIKALKNYLKIK